MTNSYKLQELTTIVEMIPQHPLIQQLNASLTIESYEHMLQDMIAHGYRQIGIFDCDRCIGLSGFWVSTKLYCGRYIEMDNVVVDAAYRSKGIGKLLTEWIIERGKSEGCQVAMLDVFVHNANAHRFYFREEYTILGFHMQRLL